MAPKKAKDNPVFSRGMKKKELERGGGFGDTAYIKKGDTLPVQFYHDPDDFLTFKEHQWDEDRKWFFVPCTGEDCPLCDDESENRSRTSYQFAAQVYNVKEKKAQVLKGGKDLGGRIYFRYERAPGKFTKRVLEITKFATSPVTHEVSPGEDKPADLKKITPIDLEEWWEKQVKAYYGDTMPKAKDLDDDDEDDDDDIPDDDDADDDDDSDDDDDEDEDDDDEDEDDDSDDDDDDDDEDDDPPPAKTKNKSKKK